MNLRWAAIALALVCCAAEAPKHFTSLQRLEESRLESVRQARLAWSRVRVVHPPIGLYRDFRAVLGIPAEEPERVLEAAKSAGVEIVGWARGYPPAGEEWTGYHHGVLFLADGDPKFRRNLEDTSDDVVGMAIYDYASDAKLHDDMAQYLQRARQSPGEGKKLSSRKSRFPDEVYAAGTGALTEFLARYDRETSKRQFTGVAFDDVPRDSYEVGFRFVSTHILAQELTADQIRRSLGDGHVYVAHDWLCDPNGFSFVASNDFGVFDMGDRVPMRPNTKLFARFPIKAHIRLMHNGELAAEANSTEFTFTPADEGAWRLEAWLAVAGEERPWIYSNPIYLRPRDPSELAGPPTSIAGNVKPVQDIVYVEGKPEDTNKHKLDLYLPLDKTNFPVLFFVHGGAWQTGDRAAYVSVGNRFAKLGIGVVIPSYRLAPANPHPAQIEDVAAAFAWTVQHIAEFGGDPQRVFAAGHSAGGHLVSLLALDPRYLKAHQLSPEALRGVLSISGFYDVRGVSLFGPDETSRRSASPIEYVQRAAPRVLGTYCQWDYPGLPAQARAFDRALRRNFVSSTLQFTPGENHVSEVLHLWKDDDPIAREMLKFMDAASR